jgi:glutathione peroxidase
MTAIYDFKVKDAKGFEKTLEEYRGKVLLIVNTASRCGFTKQYTGLEELYKNYREKGLEILGFPSNQFGGQEPGSDEEIQNFCSLTFNTTFPVLAKIDVKGKNAHPLFQYLSDKARGVLGSKAIKWNFTKFLVDRNGTVVSRFASTVTPDGLEKDIKNLL